MLIRQGQSVTINDRDNFYFGRVGTVHEVGNWSGIAMAYVQIPSASGNATIGFNIKADALLPGPAGQSQPAASRRLINEVM